jgi:hypothetical protein
MVYLNSFGVFEDAGMFPCVDFVAKFDKLRLRWGYGSDATGPYESIASKNRPFQPLTTCLMRFLLRKKMFFWDVTEMYDVDFYGASEDDLCAYLDECGTYVNDNMYEFEGAVEYLRTCPRTRETFFLRISFRWLEIINNFRRLRLFGDSFQMSDFRQQVYRAVMDECVVFGIPLPRGDLTHTSVKNVLKYANDHLD